MKKIKEKWENQEYLADIEDVIDQLTQKGAVISDLDLSGIVIDSHSTIEKLRRAFLFESDLKNVDLSYSIISGSAHQSHWQEVNLFKAKLEGCYMSKSQIKNCNFQEAKLVIKADDTIFEHSSFIKARFGTGTYGYEYGGRRTKFLDCDFTDAVFKNVEFRASKFVNCNFTRTKFIHCDLRGMKIENGILPKEEQFENMEIPDIINISN